MFDRRSVLAAGVALAATPAVARGRKGQGAPASPSFPHGFLWGASTAPHQIEGNNTSSDLW